MLKEIKFIPVDYDYFDYEGINYARITGRTESGKRVVLIDSCDIYIWAILHENVSENKIKTIRKHIENIKVEKEKRKSRVIKTEVHEKNFLGKKVKAIKIFISNLKDSHEISDLIEFNEIVHIRESDLGFITKYILEKKLKPFNWYKVSGELLNNSFDFGGLDIALDCDLCIKVEKIELCDETISKDHSITHEIVYKYRILAFDIETDDFEIGKGEIVMISIVGENYKKVLTCKGSSKKEYAEKCADESEMITKFVQYVKSYSPDFLVGYYSDGFDLPYLKSRAEKNRIKLNLGIDNSQVQFSRGRQLTAKIKGIVHVDLFRFIKIVYAPYLQSETLSLNDVSKELLGDSKIDHEFKHSSKLTIEEFENFLEYNLQDSILTYKLMQKILPDLIEFSRIIEEPLFDVSRESMSAHVENYIIHHISDYNEIIEKKPILEISERIEEEKYEGAFVLAPKPGLYENIVFFDFTSMYGSIIVSFNLSLTTYREKRELNTLEVELENKSVFFSREAGFFSLILKEIIDKRKKYKKEYNLKKDNISKARSNAFKLLANASYGYQGFFGARYYCREAAAATAAIARKYIKDTIKLIENNSYKVVYSDTDSIAFLREDKSKKQVLDLLKEINKNLPGIMELDLEDFYLRGIFVSKRTGDFGAKKKYALINEDKKLKIRGFETVRRDWCDLSRNTQNKVLELVLSDGTEKRALEFVKETIKKLKDREIDKSELIIRTQLKKPVEEYKSESPHVTIAKKMMRLNLPIKIGMLIEYYISEPEIKPKYKKLKRKNLVRERAKMLDEKGDYDTDYYLNNQILPAVENIFDVFGVSLSTLLSNNSSQKRLKDF